MLFAFCVVIVFAVAAIYVIPYLVYDSPFLVYTYAKQLKDDAVYYPSIKPPDYDLSVKLAEFIKLNWEDARASVQNIEHIENGIGKVTAYAIVATILGPMMNEKQDKGTFIKFYILLSWSIWNSKLHKTLQKFPTETAAIEHAAQVYKDIEDTLVLNAASPISLFANAFNDKMTEE